MVEVAEMEKPGHGGAEEQLEAFELEYYKYT